MTKINKNKKYIIAVGIILIFAVLISNNTVVSIFNKIFSALLPVFIAALISFFIRPLIEFVHKKIFKEQIKKYKYATLLSYLIVFLIIGLFIKLILPKVYLDALSLWENISSKQFIILLSEKIDSLYSSFNSYPILNEWANEIQAWWNTNLNTILISSANKTSSIIIKTLYIMAVSVYISLDYASIKRWIITNSKLPTQKANNVIQEISFGFKAWSKGWVKDQLFIFLCTFVALWSLGISSFITLSIIMTLFNFIPFFGAIVGSVLVWLYIVAMQTTSSGSYIFNILFVDSSIIIMVSLILLTTIQTVESLWWIPRVYSKEIAVKPLTVLVGLSVFSIVISPFFAPLTIPTIVFFKILKKHLWKSK